MPATFPPFADPSVAAAFAAFPDDLRARLLELRTLILEVGNNPADIGAVQETLKWGEPSYLTVAGSTVRLGWSAKQPDRFGLYFHCQSQLVPTFRQLYPQVFRFEGKRAIIFHRDETFPLQELRHCLLLALTYHRRKHLPRLGADGTAPSPG